ncbi:bifunctional helix-turn-helix transcriptional regulator/GNAT family N-acetyltransferase [Roseiterribacter gracilis]|uniref:GNAT family N-acetyltransferase n=1 Tax=Roseiterribacter gracilis TaxID=2812848 RepID=A0A8S8XDP8_9PROT|nr:GNAT family N-acetyltransferase [Rhodospirillales bacterium TMPK1]
MSQIQAPPRDPVVTELRQFNRWWTHKIGALDANHLGSDFSLAESRVLYELAHRDGPTASELAAALGLDAGYLSRILQRFHKDGLLARAASDVDSRRQHLTLTERGRSAFAPLDQSAHRSMAQLLAPLSQDARLRLRHAVRELEQLLGERKPDAVPYILRPLGPGDLGWVVQRHGALYAEEYGWNVEFEALTAEIVAGFGKRHDPAQERGWIAERDGVPVGCVFLMRKSATIGQLRLLLVEPSARGLGMGARLVEECVRFARQAGYKRVQLWTNDVLTSARRIYEAAGFSLITSETHTSFGKKLVAQTWEKVLNPPPR